MRPALDEYFMAVAHSAKLRSTCPRAMVGAVLVDDDRHGHKVVVGVGYNGSPSGCPHCEDVGCMAGDDGHCRLSVHAELNAILNSGAMGGHTMYSTHQPCFTCLKAAMNAGVRRIVYDDVYPDGDRDRFLALLRATNLDPVAVEHIRR